MKIVMIDNQDSFVYNLVAYLQVLGAEMLVLPVTATSKEFPHWSTIDGIVLSPGPGKPEEASISLAALEYYAGKVPILGVCLGHQVIAYHYGAKVIKGEAPVHGKVHQIKHDNTGVFNQLPLSFQVTRYHSLEVDATSLPSCLIVNAVTVRNNIMAISHVKLPIYGVQFHPEAILSQYGIELLDNFFKICNQRSFL